ncbi:hypothetical protein K438DRAFT_1764817 [Mycena galopus ATCC 62051]|nr:hypothetical protein K438DRAFT_1764817 [Mycena galopus ATCC 62051]
MCLAVSPRMYLRIFVLLALHAVRARGAPVSPSQSSFPVTNFQDLSAVISLLSGDAVEKKFCAGSRMSTVWSIFGMMGLLRANLKIAVGLSGSERAGLELHGMGGLTASRTSSSLCYWRVGQSNTPLLFRDCKDQLLSRLETQTSGGPWIRPIHIAFGYSRCPWAWQRWRCVWELIHLCLWTILTAVITTLPTLIIVPLRDPTPIHMVLLGLQPVIGLLVGAVLPLMMYRWNSNGVVNLTSLDPVRFKRPGLIQPGDHVVACRKAGVCHLIWQSLESEAARCTGDWWIVRFLAALNAAMILAAYVANYIALGDVDFVHQYAWLGCQIATLTVRFVLWSQRPVWSSYRPPCLLYMVVGSLGRQLPVHPPQRISPRSEERLDETVVEFAVAAASSQKCNESFRPARITRAALMKLIDAPADIIHTEYASVGEWFDLKGPGCFIVRLSWAFVEELYLAQGVILGNNPWALGGLYLGAILVNGNFVGLTTLHEFSAHVSECHKKQCISTIHPHHRTSTITFDGYLCSDKIYGKVVGPFQLALEPSLLEWHHKFRNNVEVCRKTSKVNGPSYVEVHASTFGPIPHLRTDITRMEYSLDLGFVKDAVQHAKTKPHETCDEWVCELDRFSYGDVGPKQGN